MSYKVIIGGDRLDLADELRDEFHAQAIAAVNDAIDLPLREIDRQLRQRRGTAQTAAPEGQPPEYDSGELAQSFRKLSGRVKGNVASAGLASNHPGVNRLEHGYTDNRGIRTLPHPFVGPAFVNTADAVTDLLNERLVTE